MNKQKKAAGPGIEWTDYTWNPIGGCQHGCRWEMPDGSVAICYAEDVAEGVASPAYPNGFAHHYWNPVRLQKPLKLKTPARVFLDSMSDVMGHWVPDEQIEQVLEVVRAAHWHTFQLLTKNAPRLLKFDLPPNLWVGVSMPPSIMFGKPLSEHQQRRMFAGCLGVLSKLKVPVRWVSFEPLSFDVAPLLDDDPPLEWAVIGAATNGRKAYQPESGWVSGLLSRLDERGIPVFFKGNLEWSLWREEFPGQDVEVPSGQMRLF